MVKMIGGCISDNVKGVPGVAEKSAIKFVMKRLSGAKLKAVMSNEGQKVIKRNRELVVLPMKRIVLEFEHDAFNIGEFEAVCRELGIKKMLKERDKWTDLFVKGQVNE
jgi:5'-3' exonuclease